jgi:hydrogenase nickel incorporation protein HypA/HybF
MHEVSLISDLIEKAAAVVTEAGAQRASRVRIRVGALSRISPAHLESHFRRVTTGSVLEGAVLDIEVVDDLTDPYAEDVIITSVDVAWEA